MKISQILIVSAFVIFASVYAVNIGTSTTVPIINPNPRPITITILTTTISPFNQNVSNITVDNMSINPRISFSYQLANTLINEHPLINNNKPNNKIVYFVSCVSNIRVGLIDLMLKRC